jgi:hypothetical protein
VFVGWSFHQTDPLAQAPSRLRSNHICRRAGPSSAGARATGHAEPNGGPLGGQRNRTPDSDHLSLAEHRRPDAQGAVPETGARMDEFVHTRIEDLLLDGDPPQLCLIHAKRGANRYVPILPVLADEFRTHLQGRHMGFLFESNRHTRYSTRTVQTTVTACAAPLASRNASIRTSSGIPSRRSRSILGWCRLIRCRNFWSTCICRPCRCMRRRVYGPSATTTSGPWEGNGSTERLIGFLA